MKSIFTELEFHSLAAEIQGEAAAPPAAPSTRVAAGAAFTIPAGAGPSASPCSRATGRQLLAISDGARTEIAEETPAEIAARWAALDRPGRAIAIADAKPLDALLARAGSAVAGEVFDVGLAQYVLAPGVASPEIDVLAFSRLGATLLSDKEAGVAGGRLSPGYEIGAADR